MHVFRIRSQRRTDLSNDNNRVDTKTVKKEIKEDTKGRKVSLQLQQATLDDYFPYSIRDTKSYLLRKSIGK